MPETRSFASASSLRAETLRQPSLNHEDFNWSNSELMLKWSWLGREIRKPGLDLSGLEHPGEIKCIHAMAPNKSQSLTVSAQVPIGSVAVSSVFSFGGKIPSLVCSCFFLFCAVYTKTRQYFDIV